MKKDKVQICIFVSAEEKEHIKRIADSFKFSQTTVVRLAIEQYYEKFLYNPNI